AQPRGINPQKSGQCNAGGGTHRVWVAAEGFRNVTLDSEAELARGERVPCATGPVAKFVEHVACSQFAQRARRGPVRPISGDPAFFLFGQLAQLKAAGTKPQLAIKPERA